VVADGRNRLFFPPEPEIYRPATQTELLFGATLVLRYEEAGKANLAGLIASGSVRSSPTRPFRSGPSRGHSPTGRAVAVPDGAYSRRRRAGACCWRRAAFSAVTAYGVNRRTRELGVRIAIGAAPGDVLRMIVGEAILMAGAGAAIGTAAVLALRSVLRSLLFDVGPSDPLTLTAVIAVLAAVIVAASYVPARRVLKIDPAAALRHE